MDSAKSYKIAISGSGGTGKTTLAEALGQALNLPVIEEGYDGKITRAKGKALELWVTEYNAVLAEKIEAEAGLDRFITDRCAIDLFNGWMNNHLHQRLPKQATGDFFKKCVAAIRHYDFVLITPWNSIPYNETEENRLRVRRNPNQFVMLRNHSSTVGLAHMLLPKYRIIELPVKIIDIDERVGFVIDQIRKRQKYVRSNPSQRGQTPSD